MYNAGNGNRYSLNHVWELLQKIEGVSIAAAIIAQRGRAMSAIPRPTLPRLAAISATIRSIRWKRACAGP